MSWAEKRVFSPAFTWFETLLITEVILLAVFTLVSLALLVPWQPVQLAA